MNKHDIKWYGLVLLCACLLVSSALAQKAGEEINWQVISGGGINNGTSTAYTLSGTVGQTATDYGSSSSYGLQSGFWQNFGIGGSGNCCLDWGIPGDANDDLAINLLDILHLIDFVYQDPVGSPPNPHGCDALLDCNGDGLAVDTPVINLIDILNMIDHVYQEPVGNPILCCPPGCLVP